VLQAGERVGDGIALQALELFIFEDDRQPQLAGCGQYVDERGLKGDERIGTLGQLGPARKHFLPEGDHLIFGNVDARKRVEEALQKLRTRGWLETLERFN